MRTKDQRERLKRVQNKLKALGGAKMLKKGPENMDERKPTSE